MVGHVRCYPLITCGSIHMKTPVSGLFLSNSHGCSFGGVRVRLFSFLFCVVLYVFLSVVVLCLVWPTSCCFWGVLLCCQHEAPIQISLLGWWFYILWSRTSFGCATTRISYMGSNGYFNQSSKWIVTGLLTRIAQRVSLVEQDLLTLPGHLISPRFLHGTRVAQSLVFVLNLIEHCLSLYTFPFGHYMSFFELKFSI